MLAKVLVALALVVGLCACGPCAPTNMRPIGGSGFSPFSGLPLAELSTWTYDGCVVFPNVANGSMMTVADQLELQTMSSADSDNKMVLLSNYSDYETSHSSWDSWSINLIIAGFSSTAEAAKIKEVLKTGKYNVITYDLDLTAYTFYYDYAGAYDQKEGNFRLAVDRLPATCSNETERWYYRQFFHDFGPSVLSQGTAGTKISFYSVFETDLLKTYNSSWVFHQTSLWVTIKMLDLGIGTSSNSTHISVDKAFTEKAWLTWQWSGGNATDYTTNRTRYLEHSYHHPVVTGTVPVPIYEPVPLNLPQRACLQKLLPEVIENNGTLPLVAKRAPAQPVREPATVQFGRPAKSRDAPLHRRSRSNTCSATTSCRPVIPGAFAFQRGYNVIQQRSSVEPLFDFEWGFTKPMPADPYHPEWTYAVPNELWMDHEQWALNNTLFQTSETAESYYREIIKISHSGGFFYSKSKTTIDIVSRHLSHNSSFGMRSVTQHLYRMGIDLTVPGDGLPGVSKFNPTFVSDVMALPKTYDAKDDSYSRFMDKWGTDYVSQAMFGGFIEMITWFDSCFYSKYSYNFIEEQSGFDFIIAKHSKGWQNAKSKLNAEWEQYRRVQTRLMGGNAGDFAPEEWEEWAESLYRFPVIYAVKPVSLELLINLVSGEHREPFAAARTDYMKTQFDVLSKFAKEHTVPQPYTPPKWCKW